MGAPVVISERILHTVKARSSKQRYSMFLSNLDQWYILYMKNLYFFSDSPGAPVVEKRIQESLSEVLDSYYHFAGRLRVIDDIGTKELDCNNAGILYATAVSHLSLEDVKSTDLEAFFVPPPDPDSLAEKPLLTIQTTHLEGGKSFAVGVAVHHVLTDASSGMSFILNWASVSHGGSLLFLPQVDRAVFKAREPPQPRFEHPEYVPQGSDSRFQRSSLQALLKTSDQFDCSASAVHRKMYSFSFEEMARLKESVGIQCSSFEAMAALLWRAHTAAVFTGPDKKLCLRFNMDIRNILQPPLSENFSGNAVFAAMARATLSELLEEPLSATVERIQNARKMVTDEYLRSALDFLELHPDRWSGQDSAVTTAINSWPRVMRKALDVDFGWGKPARVEFPLHSGNRALVIFPLNEQGVNVSVPIDPEAVPKFEKILALAGDFSGHLLTQNSAPFSSEPPAALRFSCWAASARKAPVCSPR